MKMGVYINDVRRGGLFIKSYGITQGLNRDTLGRLHRSAGYMLLAACSALVPDVIRSNMNSGIRIEM